MDDVVLGSELAFTLTLPFAGTHTVRGAVLQVGREPAGNRIAVEVGWREPGPVFLGGVAEYLMLTDARLSPATLRAAGFPVHAGTAPSPSARQPHWIWTRSWTSGYGHQGQRRDVTAAGLASPFDTFARHLVCRYGGRIVGYARVIVVGDDPARSQYVSWGGHEIPRCLWEAGFLEAGAGTVDPEFHGAGCSSCWRSTSSARRSGPGHRYVLAACEDVPVDVYASMGFELLETRHVEPRPGWRFRSHLIVLDIDGLVADRLSGRNVAAMRPAALFGRDGRPGSLGEDQHLTGVTAQRPGAGCGAGGQPQDE